MEEALVALLMADAGVGAALGTRIWWARAPQGQPERPYCVLRLVSGPPDYHMGGPSGLVRSRIQFDAYGETYEQAKTASRALAAAISGYRGQAGAKTFQGAFIDGGRDLPDEDDAGEHLFAVSFDIILWHD